MKTLKSIILLIFTLSSWSNANAQSHNLKPGLCAYAKPCSGCGVDPDAPKCQACSDTKKKEFEARKQSDEAIWAKAKAEKDAAEKVRLEKLRLAQEEAKKIKKDEVIVNLPKNTAQNTSNIKKEEPKKITAKKGMMYGGFVSHDNHSYFYAHQSDYFLNQANDTILKNKEWRETRGNSEYSINFPANTGIVFLKENNTVSGCLISDIVDNKGKRYFNDENISMIFHFADDYFITLEYPHTSYPTYFPRSSPTIQIINIKTKEKYLVKKGKYKSIEMHLIPENQLKETDLRPKNSFKNVKLFEIGWHNFIVVYVNLDGKLEIEEFYYPEKYYK